MSATITMPRAEFELIFNIAQRALGQEAGAVLSKTSKTIKADKADKKPRANAGQGTAWSAFCSKIQQDHKQEVDAVKAAAALARKAAKEAGEVAPADTQGAHLHWCSRYKEAHPAEWEAYKTKWELEHPKGSRATSVADDASVAESAVASEASEAKPKKGRKPMTEEAKAAAAVKRAATKAAKAAPAPIAEPAVVDDAVVEEAEVELEEEAEAESVTSVDASEDALITWTSPKGVSYLRVGHLDADGDGVWNEGNWLWAKDAKGNKGAYAGVLLANGKIDSSPATLAEEPEL
jgi:hypothetical protein